MFQNTFRLLDRWKLGEAPGGRSSLDYSCPKWNGNSSECGANNWAIVLWSSIIGGKCFINIRQLWEWELFTWELEIKRKRI
jgi:hypothetical protein